MKTQSQEKINLVADLAKYIDLRKQAEKAEKKLKAEVRAFMGDNSTLEAGEFLVLVKEMERSGVDMDRIKIDLGEKFSEYATVTSYETVEVRRVKL